jgi:hypothetical protein
MEKTRRRKQVAVVGAVEMAVGVGEVAVVKLVAVTGMRQGKGWTH